MFEMTAEPGDVAQVALPAAAQEPAQPHLAELERLLQGLPVRRRRLRRRQALFRGGQACHSLYLVHAGIFKTCVLSADGREKITGFHLRGDLLGIDSFGASVHGCDAIALDTCEVWELPLAQLQHTPALLRAVTVTLANEVRRDWSWMLVVGTLNAEQRVVAFLLDLASRLGALGFSAQQLRLRMTRAEVGNFLAMQLETVTRTLSRLADAGLIVVDGREIGIRDAGALRALVAAGG